ncbi:SWIM-type domain-containing protein [Pycnococcus provasolii]
MLPESDQGIMVAVLSACATGAPIPDIPDDGPDEVLTPIDASVVLTGMTKDQFDAKKFTIATAKTMDISEEDITDVKVEEVAASSERRSLTATNLKVTFKVAVKDTIEAKEVSDRLIAAITDEKKTYETNLKAAGITGFTGIDEKSVTVATEQAPAEATPTPAAPPPTTTKAPTTTTTKAPTTTTTKAPVQTATTKAPVKTVTTAAAQTTTTLKSGAASVGLVATAVAVAAAAMAHQHREELHDDLGYKSRVVYRASWFKSWRWRIRCFKDSGTLYAPCTWRTVRGKDVTNAFAGKVLKEAKALASASLSASKFKPLAELVNASGIGHLTVHTTNAEGMKKIYKARMKAEHELKEKDLPDKAKTPFVEPNTEHITDEGGEYLTGYTYVPGAIKALWNAGLVEKTPSFADGAHSEGAFGGTFLSTTTLDANRHLLPMCVTWTIMNEDKESWTSHYRAVKEHYPALDVSTHANITDGDKGLKPSRAEVFPNMLGFSCERHRSENVRVQPGVGSAGRDAYREAVYGYSAAKLAHAKSIMNAQTKAYLEKLPDKCQYLRAAFEAGAHLRGYAVSSPAESWNNWMTNQSVRHNANVVQSFLNLMDGIENQTEKRIAAAAKRTDAAPPKIRLLLNSGGEAKKKVRDRVVVFQNNLRRVAKVWHKSYPGICQTVNLNDGTCTCCRPEIVGGPFCVSLASAAKSAGVDLAKFLPPQETTKRWREQWEYVHQWRAGKTIPCIADLALLPEHPLKDPVAGPRPKGRPAEPKRHLSAVEDAAKQHKCKVCGMKGHNARSKQCPKFSLTAHDTTLALPGGDEDDENEEEEFMMPQEESGEE